MGPRPARLLARRPRCVDRLTCERTATFISPISVLCHDVAFSRAPARVRRATCLALSPITWIAYALHRPASRGTETASAWRKAPAG